jgi:hypothetical protein
VAAARAGGNRCARREREREIERVAKFYCVLRELYTTWTRRTGHALRCPLLCACDCHWGRVVLKNAAGFSKKIVEIWWDWPGFISKKLLLFIKKSALSIKKKLVLFIK